MTHARRSRSGALGMAVVMLLAAVHGAAAWGVERGEAADPKLPRVLMIGDSVLAGYKEAVKTHLAGKATVDCWVTPLWVSHKGLVPGLAKAVEGHRYDVVHFNHGLHGFANRIPEGKYEPLLRKYIGAMRQLTPGAWHIWASTTPVTVKGKPEQPDPEKNPLVVERNKIAAKVMWENGIEVNDLYGLAAGKPELRSLDGFHYGAKGRAVQAEAVAKAIAATLARRATMSPAQMAWDTTLRQQLGRFYLPRYLDAKKAGRKTVWDLVTDDPKLPRVLLIGDSISGGYTLPVRRLLAGKVNLHRAPANCGSTARGLRGLDTWLGDGKWDVIHFNFGIHDRRSKREDYEKRLETIVAKLKATGARLIWATTTPVPPHEVDRSPDIAATLNAVAAKVMTRHDIPINDLYAHIKPHIAEYRLPNNSHYRGPGSQHLGKKVAEAILAALR